MRTGLRCAIYGFPTVLFLILFFVAPAHSQTSRGTVSGTVLDGSGAVIFGGEVELTNRDTGVVTTTTTNGAGIYRFDAVDLGWYKLKISKQGFKTQSRESFPVEANRTVTFNETLVPGDLQETIEVIGSVQEAQLIKDGPLRGGSFDSSELLQLPYGIGSVMNTLPGYVLGTGMNINGQRPRSNNWKLDGMDNNDVNAGRGWVLDLRPLDAVQEFSMQTGNFGVEFSGAGGVVVTKSGTNEFHGALSWRLGSQVFDSIPAQTKLNTPAGQEPLKPVYTNNIYGFTLGGPIVKKKTFFLAAFEQNSYRATASSSFVLPTEEAVTRLKSLFPNNPRLNLYLNAIGNLRGAANLINLALGNDPTTGVDRGAVQFGRTYLSMPNANGSPQWTFNLDHNLSNIHRLSFRYIYLSLTAGSLMAFPGYYYHGERYAHNFLFTDNYTIGPNWANESRFSYSRTSGASVFDSNSIPEAFTLPYFLIPNVSTPLQNGMPAFAYVNKWQVQETQTKLIGRHTFRYGFELVRNLSKKRAGFNDRGLLNYRDATGYSGFANFLDDFSGPSGASTRNFGEAVFYPDQLHQSYFFQDHWKLTPNLDLTLGLRYENYGAPANNMKYPAFAGFDPEKFFLPNKVNTDNNNIGPSFGFAWSPNAGSGLLGKIFGEGKTVWRGGFQISYSTFWDDMLTGIQSDVPNSVATLFTAPSTGRGAANFFSTIPDAPRAITLLDPQTNILDPNIRNPYTELWSFGFQRKLPQGFILDLSYVGSAAHKLFTRVDANPRQLNGIREHPDFGSRQIISSIGNSNYHSMQLRVERRFAGALYFTGSYTWSRSIDSTSEVTSATSIPASQGGMQLDRGLSDFNRSHVASLIYSWAIPGPKGGFLKYLAGGWRISGWTNLMTGIPFTVLNGSDRNGDGISTMDRPDIGNPNAPLDTRAIIAGSCSTGYLNPDTNACVSPNDVHFIQGTGLPNSRTVGRNAFVAGGLNQTEASLLKAFPFREGKKLELRVEVMNIFNHGNYPNPPNSNVVSAPGPSGGMPSRFMNKYFSGSDYRTAQVQAKIIF
jgi:hypothetical protein